MPFFLFWLFLPFHIVMGFLVGLSLMRKGRGRVFLRAKRDALLMVPKILRKRVSIQKSRRIGYWRVLSLLNFGFYRS